MSRTLECRLMKLSGEFLYQELSQISLQLKPHALLKTHGHLNSAEKPLPKTHTAILQTASNMYIAFLYVIPTISLTATLENSPRHDRNSTLVARIIEIGNIGISKRSINEGKRSLFIYWQYIIKWNYFFLLFFTILELHFFQNLGTFQNYYSNRVIYFQVLFAKWKFKIYS